MCNIYLHLVALGGGHLPHIVTEAHDLELPEKRSGPQKSRRRNKVSENSFANFKRKAGRNPSTESGITNGNFDNKKHTAQRKNFRWRCLHSENSSRPEKNAINPMDASQTMRTSFKAIPAEKSVTFPVQEPRKIYEKRRISHKNRTYQEKKSRKFITMPKTPPQRPTPTIRS